MPTIIIMATAAGRGCAGSGAACRGPGATPGFRGTRAKGGRAPSAHITWATAKELWCQTSDDEAFVQALDSGVRTFLFDDARGAQERDLWIASCLERSQSADGVRVLHVSRESDAVLDASGERFAEYVSLSRPEDTIGLGHSLTSSSAEDSFVVSFDPAAGSPSR